MTQAPIPPLNAEPFGHFLPGLLWQMLMGRRDLSAPAKPASRAWINRCRRWLRRWKPVFDITHDGVKLRLYPAENVCDRKLTLSGTHPVHEEFDIASAHLTKARTLVDIGANVGIYSLLARRRMAADARIVAFEPDPRTVRKLRQNLDFNTADNVTVINAAVGSRDEVLTLYSALPNNVGRNTLQKGVTEGRDAPSVQVQVRPLLDVLNEQGVEQIDVMKIDVEAFEAEALGPFFDSAPRSLWPRYLMIEITLQRFWSQDLVARFRDMGYSVAYETDADMHFVLPDSMAEGG